jgi:hypothetical protein
MLLAVASIEAGHEISVDVSLCRMVSSSFNEFETKIPALKLCYHCSTNAERRRCCMGVILLLRWVRILIDVARLPDHGINLAAAVSGLA